MCRMISRAYDNQLFTSGQGTFSCRLPDNSMIITPYAMDRKYLNPEDLVLVRETPKEPSARRLARYRPGRYCCTMRFIASIRGSGR
ncbi:MAG: class II aldolase/adducin family protein [Clostridia bacterium]